MGHKSKAGFAPASKLPVKNGGPEAKKANKYGIDNALVHFIQRNTGLTSKPIEQYLRNGVLTHGLTAEEAEVIDGLKTIHESGGKSERNKGAAPK